MNYNLQNKLTKFGIYIVLYVFGIFVFFNLVFDKKEMKTEVTVNNVEEIKNLNANGIDVSKLSTKVNTGKKANILSEKTILDGLNNSNDKEIQEILKSKDKLSFSYLALLYRNPSAKLFIKDKLENRTVDNFIGESVDFKRDIPYYLQWDRRWGQKKYTDENIAINGCGPTSMAMVISGLLKDDSITPVEMAKYEEYAEGSGTGWQYFTEVPQKYGIKVKELSTNEKIYKDELKNGRPIIANVGPGDFSSIGHYIVLVGVDEDGMFIINDSSSPTNTNEKWSFERLKPQIKNSWSFDKGE
ncbi:C39 family peptidase [Parvimonas sp. G1425]|uniref:C39 family peptidase n=1 Tax=Parvimonas sp. G1425 TaxID=3387694 RepID=UPI0039E6A003